MKKYAVIVAGGKGLRMGTAVSKQFLPLNDKPILYHTIKAFLDAYEDMQLVLVLPIDQLSYAQMVLQCFPERIDVTIVTGGVTRFHSVQNGLKECPEDSVIFVHDGVRPLVTPGLIQRCYEQALAKGTAIPTIAVTDSMRLVDEDDSEPISRDALRIIQTPQTFRADILLPAFQQEFSLAFTDEATVVEAYGTNVDLIEGERSNIKVTTPEDLLIAEALLQSQNAKVKS
ncbi:MAG: 2-C-methyl-D-erythritol 4-phosphate cytidylyltransferase [Sphingobacteriales bacterium]|nr:MAG: 2-C-methyl-D-erythritol 4-phosphate cytidylyltransferase [Sphingobacteriales bacterium]